MKKLIYPIAAVFALITVASFTSDDCRTKCARKEAAKTRGHNSKSQHNQVAVLEIGPLPTSTQGDFLVVGKVDLPTDVVSVEMLAPIFQISDEQIDIQFSREETTIEVPDVLNADEIVTYQFNDENGAVLAHQAKQAAY